MPMDFSPMRMGIQQNYDVAAMNRKSIYDDMLRQRQQRDEMARLDKIQQNALQLESARGENRKALQSAKLKSMEDMSALANDIKTGLNKNIALARHHQREMLNARALANQAANAGAIDEARAYEEMANAANVRASHFASLAAGEEAPNQQATVASAPASYDIQRPGRLSMSARPQAPTTGEPMMQPEPPTTAVPSIFTDAGVRQREEHKAKMGLGTEGERDLRNLIQQGVLPEGSTLKDAARVKAEELAGVRIRERSAAEQRKQAGASKKEIAALSLIDQNIENMEKLWARTKPGENQLWQTMGKLKYGALSLVGAESLMPEEKQYLDQVKGFASVLAKGVAGEKGALAEGDVMRAMSIVADLSDKKTTGQEKFQMVKDIVTFAKKKQIELMESNARGELTTGDIDAIKMRNGAELLDMVGKLQSGQSVSTDEFDAEQQGWIERQVNEKGQSRLAAEAEMRRFIKGKK